MKKLFVLLLTGIILSSGCSKHSDSTVPAPPSTPAITGQVPVVTTRPMSAITQTAAASGGSVTNDGGSAVTFRGICYGTSANPTIAGSKTLDGSGTGDFTSSLKGLTEGLKYYVRAYATNSSGTGYGSQQTFFALALGQLYQGGRLAYLLQEGDAGYSADIPHGLVVAAQDNGAAGWDNGNYFETGASQVGYGKGAANTALIVSKIGKSIFYPARNFDELVEGGYDDWYLPSRDELLKVYAARAAIGNMKTDTYYWTSSEQGSMTVWIVSFITGVASSYDKRGKFESRAVRSF